MGVALSLSGLAVGPYNDDYAHRAILQGLGPGYDRNPLRLYEFTRGPAHVRTLLDAGGLPWWSDDALQLRFFRPLGSALVSLDHALSPHSAVAWHLHGLVWMAALFVAAGVALRALLPPRAALVAACAYASAEHHLTVSAWLSARPGLVGATFAVAALGTHVRARQAGAARSWGAVALLAVALLGSELALGAVALLAAWELLAAPGDRRTRAGAAAPAVGLSLVYVGLYVACGFGTRASGAYVDPLHDPVAFLRVAAVRWPVLLAEPIVNLPSEALMAAPAVGLVLAALSLGVLGALAVWWARGRTHQTSSETRTLAALGVGAALALAPGVGGVPGGRLLAVAGVGVAAVAGSALVAAWDARAASRGLRRLGLSAAVALLALPMFLLGPLLRVAFPLGMARVSDAQARFVSDLDWRCGPDADVIVPVAADPAVGMYAALVLGTSNKHGRNFRVLSMAPHRHALRRDDAHTLSLRVLDGGRMLATPMERVYRSPARPLATGDRREMQGATVTVTATEAGHPTALRLQSVRPLAEPGVCLLEWRDGALRPLAPPAVGDEVVLGHWPGPMGQ